MFDVHEIQNLHHFSEEAIQFNQDSLENRLAVLEKLVGNTPLMKLDVPHIDLYAKLEYFNFMGSIKDRTAVQIIKRAVEKGEITRNTTVIEASSGNFAIATAAVCNFLCIPFVAVIDPNVNRVYHKLLAYFCANVINVDKKDKNNGYLLTKLEAVEDYLENNEDAFWTNQYRNCENFNAHYEGTGLEICRQMEQVDYAFVAVATGGTLAGVSARLKEHFPEVKIVAVDAEGSVIFGTPAKPRLIPGMGSGIQPHLINRAQFDEVVHVKELDTVASCRELFYRHGIFAGGSTGAVYHAVNAYFADRPNGEKPRVVFICPDRGLAYADNIYDHAWLNNLQLIHKPCPEPEEKD